MATATCYGPYVYDDLRHDDYNFLYSLLLLNVLDIHDRVLCQLVRVQLYCHEIRVLCII